MISRKFYPNFCTSINLFIGFMSILYTIDGQFITAAWLILLSLLVDGLDGQVARMTKGYSEFGANYDSLSDLISFGLSPALLIYFTTRHMFPQAVSGGVAFMLLLGGAIRLARFNSGLSDLETKEDFTGLPIPMAAVLLSSYYLFMTRLDLPVGFLYGFLFLGALVSILMVSNITFINFGSLLKNVFKNKLLLTIFIITLLVLVIIPHYIFLPVFLLYLFYGLIWHLVAMHRKVFEEDSQVEMKIEEKEKK